MKKSHIVFLVLIVATISVLVSSFANFSTYETFASAAVNPNKVYKVYGLVEKDMDMKYDPKVDPNHFTFYAKDKEGTLSKVILNDARPRDIEKSEFIVMTGYQESGTFHCSSIQMKCPSKYKKEMVTAGKSS